jgi:hypothetical protein
MNICFTASRLMKALEVKEICQEIRNNPEILIKLETVVRKELYKRISEKEKAAS